MTEARVLAAHPAPYTIADLEAMPDDGQRYELIDGGLLVTPSPTPLHQLVAGRLRTLLSAAAPPGFDAVEAIDVDCGKNTILQPDVVALRTTAIFGGGRIVPAADVALVVEIMSPPSVRIDRVLKPHIYADAGIPAYLLVELEGPTVTWFALSGSGGYTRRGSATGADELLLTKPFDARIVPAELVRPHG